MPSKIHRLAGAGLASLPSLLTIAVLAAVGGWGIYTDWKFPKDQDKEGKKEDESSISVVKSDGDRPARITFHSEDDIRKAGLVFAEARTGTVTRSVDAAGSIGYDHSLYSVVSARAPGIVWWIQKIPGETVRAGEVLALVESGEVGRAKAAFLSDLTQIELRTQHYERVKDSTIAERTIHEARAALEEAQTSLLNDQQALLNLGLQIEADSLRKVPPAQRAERIRFLGLPEEALPLVRGRTESANLLPVISALAGSVVKRNVSQGEGVVTVKPLFTIADTRVVHLELAVEPRDMTSIRKGMKVLFRPDGAGFEATGTLAHFVPEVDEQTRKVWVHAEAENPDGKLLPNAYGSGRIIVAEDISAIVVPETALQRNGEEWLIFVRTENTTFEARKVKPGLRGDGMVAVDSVQPGEKVVTTGSHALRSELLRDQLAGGD